MAGVSSAMTPRFIGAIDPLASGSLRTLTVMSRFSPAGRLYVQLKARITLGGEQ
jgi:hypothetical protein